MLGILVNLLLVFIVLKSLKWIERWLGEAGLIANYPFDDNANDATPYLNHGTIGGNPTFITHTGFTGKALKFDGDRDSVIVRNAVQLISDYTSVGFWIRVDSVNIANAESYIIDFGHYDNVGKFRCHNTLELSGRLTVKMHSSSMPFQTWIARTATNW